MEAANRILLRTKTRPPALRPGLTGRETLLSRVRRSRTRLTALIAPAGWGKTTLLSAWAQDEREQRPVAWLQLDPGDGNPIRLWEYVLAATETALDATLDEERQLLAAPGLSPTEGAIPAFLNKCADADPFVLVLDDLHLIEGSEATETLEFAISHLPPPLHLAVATRSDPDLPLARLRARGELTEVRAADLAMTPDEVARSLTEVTGLAIGSHHADALAARTEGWPAGVYLTGLALRGQSDWEARLGQIAGEHRHLVDYFGLEVLAGLEDNVRRSLLGLSMVDRFNAELADFILERDDSLRLLREIDRANLFLVALDDRREWYRFHHLFRDLLRHELALSDPEWATTLLRRAAVWFRRNGDPDTAMALYLENADLEEASEVVIENAVPLLDRGKAKTVLRWLDALPDEAYRDNARLSLLAAWLRSLARDFGPVPRLLDEAEKAQPRDVPVPGAFSSGRALSSFLRGAALGFGPARDLEAAITAGREAVEAEPEPVGVGFILARSMLGSALLHSGQTEDARSLLKQAYEEGRAVPQGRFAWTGVAGIYALALLVEGRVAPARKVLDEVLDGEEAAEDRHPERVFALIASGRLAGLEGDAQQALRRLRTGVRLARFWGQDEVIVLATAWLAEAALRTGAMAEARRAIGEAFDRIEADGSLPLPRRIAEDTAKRLRLVTRRRTARDGPLVEELTDREVQLLQLLPGGESMSQMAERLYLSANTVKGYAKTLYRKLGVSSRQEAVEVARHLDLI